MIPLLYRLGKELKKPMTAIVNSMIRESLVSYSVRKPGEAAHCAVCGELERKKEMKKVKVKVGSGKVITILICHRCYGK
jgi:hypothetical protein